jgi:hypothetical protein
MVSSPSKLVVPNLCFREIGIDCDTVTKLYRAEIEGAREGVKNLLSEGLAMVAGGFIGPKLTER